VIPARTVALGGDTSIRKSVTIGVGVVVAETVDPLLNVTVALLPKPPGATTFGVTTMLTVTLSATFIAPIEHVMELGVPLGVVQDPFVVEALVNGASLVLGSTSEKFTLNAGSGPVLVIRYLYVRVFPAPTVVGVGVPVIVRVLRAPIFAMKASLVPLSPGWNACATGKLLERVCPET
jgi:hypothetical protein